MFSTPAHLSPWRFDYRHKKPSSLSLLVSLTCLVSVTVCCIRDIIIWKQATVRLNLYPCEIKSLSFSFLCSLFPTFIFWVNLPLSPKSSFLCRLCIWIDDSYIHCCRSRHLICSHYCFLLHSRCHFLSLFELHVCAYGVVLFSKS